MADEADQASEQQERELRASLSRREAIVCATGRCAYCNEPTNPQRVFCSPDCSSDWHLEMKLRKLSGR